MNNEIKVREIPGFPGRYYLDEDDNIWSHFPDRKVGEPWLKLKGRDGHFKLVSVVDGKLVGTKYAHAELINSVEQKRLPVPVVDPPTLEERLALVEAKLDAILLHLGVPEEGLSSPRWHDRWYAVAYLAGCADREREAAS